MMSSSMRGRRRSAWAVAMGMALAGGVALGGRAEATTEPAPVEGGPECSVLSSSGFEGFCPDAKGPKRKRPWTPVIAVPERPDDRPCDALNFFFEDTRSLRCPGSEPGPFAARMRIDGPAGGGRAEIALAAPAGYTPGDVLPTFRICYRWEDMPEEIVVTYPWDDVYIGSGRVTISCCDDC